MINRQQTLLQTTLTAARARLHDTNPLDEAPPPALSAPMQQALNELYQLLQVALTTPDAPTPSALLIGPPGSGKSLLANRALYLIDDQRPVVIHLSGLLHAAPLPAWRHLAKSLSDALGANAPTPAAAGVQHYLGAIVSQIALLREAKRPIVFVLHDFDRFVSSVSAGMSQNVLYSLFNFMQDSTLRAACIAMTSHIDVTDGLEKRVKSRFAHREIVVPLPDDVADVLTFVKHALVQPVDDVDDDSVIELHSDPTFDTVAEGLLESDRCRKALNKFMFRTRVMAPILRAFDAALVAAFDDEIAPSSIGKRRTTAQRVDVACEVLEDTLSPDDTSSRMMAGLSVLEIALLVSLRNLQAFAEEHNASGNIVFRDVFRQYQTLERADRGFISNSDGERTMARGVAEKAWERLVECGLVARLGHGPKEMRQVTLAVASELVDEALRNHERVSTVMRNWGKMD